ncbi:MAG TPA: nucleotidyltransferase family protein [Patescibacteria group bacterium]|nr:nucleotidyltransferase family protein [Patescibacteria group bacterium]
MKKSQLLRLRHVKTFGNSMSPLLIDGDIVYLKRKKFDLITIDDIVCIYKREKLFTHRVIYRANNYIITRGDNSSVSDGRSYSRNIVGVVEKIKREEEIYGINDLYLIQSTLYLKEVLKLQRAFKKTSLDFVFLKGLPLYLYLDGELPKRIYADCDLLVDNFILAERIFKKLGYRKERLGKDMFQMKKDKEASFYKLVKGFPVVFDLHKEVVFIMVRAGNLNMLYPQSLIQKLTNKFLVEKKYIRLKKHGELLPILSMENLIVYLCLHLFNHNFAGPYRYDFLNKVLKKKFDLHDVLQTINDFQLVKFVYPAFFLLKKYYFSKTSAEVIKKMNMSINIHKYTHKNLFSAAPKPFGSGEYFIAAFNASPIPIWKRCLVLLDTRVVVVGFKVIIKKITDSFRDYSFRF